MVVGAALSRMLLGFTMLLGLKPCFTCDPITCLAGCLAGVPALTAVAANLHPNTEGVCRTFGLLACNCTRVCVHQFGRGCHVGSTETIGGWWSGDGGGGSTCTLGSICSRGCAGAIWAIVDVSKQVWWLTCVCVSRCGGWHVWV
jgi:hypothetical protein